MQCVRVRAYVRMLVLVRVRVLVWGGGGREGPGGREGGLKNSGGWMLMLRVKPCQHEVAADYSREEKIIESTAILKSTS